MTRWRAGVIGFYSGTVGLMAATAAGGWLGLDMMLGSVVAGVLAVRGDGLRGDVVLAMMVSALIGAMALRYGGRVGVQAAAVMGGCVLLSTLDDA